MRSEGVMEDLMDKKKLFFLVMFTLLVSPVPDAHAQKMGNQLLTGLTTVQVRVQYSDESGMKATGTESSQLVADTERQLSGAGLKIVSSSDFDRLAASRGYPIALLDIGVRLAKIADTDMKMYTLSVRLRQVVYIARMPTLYFLGGTWDVTDSGTMDNFSFVRERLSAIVSNLVNDYKSENPK
jgi:hypothetical protein